MIDSLLFPRVIAVSDVFLYYAFYENYSKSKALWDVWKFREIYLGSSENSGNFVRNFLDV